MSAFRKSLHWLEQRLNLSEMFSFVTTFGISYAPLNPNLPLEEVTRQAFLQPMPSYQRWPHIFGILTFVTFLLEVLTGLLLAFYFQPSVGKAYETTRFIIRDSSFGWYIHQMHFWGGQLLVVLLLVRLVRFFLDRVYQPPRELTWIFGLVLFFLAVQACFTGGLLPWDQRGYWSTIRGLELLEKIPILGPALRFFIGGFTLGDALLLRFYLLHVIFLPVLTFVFFYLHFATVRRIGLSRVSYVEDKAVPIYPGHLMNLLIILLAIFGGLLTLAMLFPDPFSTQANPFNTPPGISVSWYLMPLYGLFELLPALAASWLCFVVLCLLLILPFLDKGTALRRRGITVLAIFFLIAVAYLSYIGYSRRG